MIPNTEHAATIRLFSHQCWAEIHQLFSTYLGGSPLAAPSSYKERLNDDLRPLIDKYYRGSDSTAEQRIKLFKLIWDAIGTEFGARHELYEINYSGSHEEIRRYALFGAMATGTDVELKQFVEKCMSEYDLDGWTAKDLVNTDKFSVLKDR